MKQCAWVLLVLPAFYFDALAQEPGQGRSEIFMTIGAGHLFRGDRGLDDGANIGGGYGFRLHRKVGAEIVLTSLSGLSPGPSPCGGIGKLVDGKFVPFPCEGTARNGADRYRLLSTNILYYFTNSRVQPYLTAGVGVARTSGFYGSFYPTGGEVVHIVEQQWRETAFAWNIGTGLRVFLAPRVSIRPEFRWHNSIIKSRQNLGLRVVSIGLGFHL